MGGKYYLYDGQLTVTNSITVGLGDFANYAYFYQYGGNVNADTTVNGNYILSGGTIRGRMTVAQSGQRVNGSVVQSGGTNSAPSMDLGHPNQFGGGAIYTLSNGVVRVDTSTTFGGGWFYQNNGRHTIVSNLVMQGRNVGPGNAYAEYYLFGGTLSVGGLTEQSDSHIIQSGGTNLIAGDLALSAIPPYENTYYNLSGGTLAVRNISIGSNSSFQHTGGNIVQSGVLILIREVGMRLPMSRRWVRCN
jgi:hypothetical protein